MTFRPNSQRTGQTNPARMLKTGLLARSRACQCYHTGMNLLSLIIIFLALIICAAVGFIAWELTTDEETLAKRKRGSKTAPRGGSEKS